MQTIKARFVGGEWHNRLIECQSLPVIRVPARRPVTVAYGPASLVPSQFECESYYLCRFYTAGRTIYSQYVHESLMRSGEPQPEAYCEDEFAPMPESMFEHFIGRLITANRPKP